MPQPITVFLVDDHSMFRAGVRAELTSSQSDVPAIKQNSEQAPVEIIGESGTVSEAIAGIKKTNPDVVLLDVHMPDGGGLEVLLKTRDTSTRFLVLSVSDAPEDVIALIRAGARGYVTKNTSGDQLVEFIRRVHNEDAVFSPRLAGYVLDAFSGTAPELSGHDSDDSPFSDTVTAATASGDESSDDPNAPNLDELTPREHDVLRLLARGYTYREMAERLFISIKTVETHVSNILRKTQQTNRHSLSRWLEGRA